LEAMAAGKDEIFDHPFLVLLIPAGDGMRLQFEVLYQIVHGSYQLDHEEMEHSTSSTDGPLLERFAHDHAWVGKTRTA
jgi:hypothetical protein